MSPTDQTDLPFTCPECDTAFGFGDSAALMSIVTVVPFTNAPTPCCGHPITGQLVRNPRTGVVEMELTA